MTPARTAGGAGCFLLIVAAIVAGVCIAMGETHTAGIIMSFGILAAFMAALFIDTTECG